MATHLSSPVFRLPESQHFSDYGFDPQIDYFQVLKEARTHKKESSSSRHSDCSQHFKLKKSISKDPDHNYFQFNSKKSKVIRKKSSSSSSSSNPSTVTKKGRWWKNALLFIKSKLSEAASAHPKTTTEDYTYTGYTAAGGQNALFINGPPIYFTDTSNTRSGGCATPHRYLSQPSLAGSTLTPARKGDVDDIPYLCLRDLNMVHHYPISAPSPLPIYLVT